MSVAVAVTTYTPASVGVKLKYEPGGSVVGPATLCPSRLTVQTTVCVCRSSTPGSVTVDVRLTGTFAVNIGAVLWMRIIGATLPTRTFCGAAVTLLLPSEMVKEIQ